MKIYQLNFHVGFPIKCIVNRKSVTLYFYVDLIQNPIVYIHRLYVGFAPDYDKMITSDHKNWQLMRGSMNMQRAISNKQLSASKLT